VFQDKQNDQITITTLNSQPIKLNSFAVYQVSEQSSDNLIVEGWNGTIKEYSEVFTNNSTWKILTLNYEDINKVIIKLNPSGTGGIADYNFDNFSFNTSPLPVELVEFKAKVIQQSINLEWKTATELNNYGFEIEREDSITNWQKIGFINGNGTNSSPQYYRFIDNNIKNGYKYSYRLKQIDNNGNYKYSPEIEVTANLAPLGYSLSQNYPNPFNPSTVINYHIANSGKVVLRVYDIVGRVVATLVDEYKDAGSYSVTFSTKSRTVPDLSSGMYIYELETNGFVSRNKMMLLK